MLGNSSNRGMGISQGRGLMGITQGRGMGITQGRGSHGRAIVFP